MFPGHPAELPLSEVDFADLYFKTGRKHADEDLVKSIEKSGVLIPPFVIERPGGGYRIVAGFNRLEALRILGFEKASLIAAPDVAADDFIRYALFKNYHGLLGPSGKLKALRILSDYFGVEPGRINDLAVSALVVPGVFLSGGGMNRFFDAVPESLRDYFDEKNVSYRLIWDICTFPPPVLQKLASWTEQSCMKVNVFRNICGLLYELLKRDGEATASGLEIPSEISSRNEMEDYLMGALYSRRYPLYSGRRAVADRLIAEINGRGVNVSFPEYFEGDRIRLTFTLGRKEGTAGLMKKVSSLDSGMLEELLGML